MAVWAAVDAVPEDVETAAAVSVVLSAFTAFPETGAVALPSVVAYCCEEFERHAKDTGANEMQPVVEHIAMAHNVKKSFFMFYGAVVL